jgi:hypothetical protein
MTSLPAWSGKDSDCPKCGTPFPAAEYHATGGPLAPKMRSGGRAPCADNMHLHDVEHLCRICSYCGYIWQEACADGEGTQ